ncbi:hypothetical protein [Massilia sp. UBA6681]|uniref:hypothetical protein n=1 Tax=Massilia sp. UBA6681 TaxID=1946839 RepID=UPI0025C198FD|nr:hypothetical protein [Massilia sp. UBA6681]
MDTDINEKLIKLLREQQLFNVFVLGCLIDLVEANPEGERRGKYLDKVGPVIDQVKRFNEAYDHFRGPHSDEDADES